MLHTNAVVVRDPVGRSLHAGQGPAPRALDLEAWRQVWDYRPHVRLLIPEGRIAPPGGLRGLQEPRRPLAVMHLSRASDQMMDEPGLAVNPDTQFHAARPLPSMAHGVHFRIPLPLLVLGRGGGVDPRGVQHRPLPQTAASLHQILLDQLEDLSAQCMRFRQVPVLA